MTIESTYAELFNRSKELIDFGNNYPTVRTFLHKEFDAFQKNNGGHIKKLHDTQTEIYEENVIKKDDGTFSTISDANGVLVGLNFKSSIHEKDFNTKIDELMNRRCSIVL